MNYEYSISLQLRTSLKYCSPNRQIILMYFLAFQKVCNKIKYHNKQKIRMPLGIIVKKKCNFQVYQTKTIARSSIMVSNKTLLGIIV